MKKTCNYCGNLFEKTSKNRNYCAEHSSVKFMCSFYRRNHREKIRKESKRRRDNNLEKYRKMGRRSQLVVNNRNRFGGLRDIVLERDCYKCVKCGIDISKKYFANIHHIDRNKKNNVLENLESICKSCHALIHYKEDRTIDKLGRFKAFNK